MTTVLWILIYVALFYFMARFGCGAHGSHRRHGDHAVVSARIDPVCGMAVSDEDSFKLMYHKGEYRFCSHSCLEKFEANPERYTDEGRLAS
jgi:YHS domain-containing protein